MKQLFSIGDTKVYKHMVTEADTATFAVGNVHPVYATFALTRDAEWAGRLFVLDMLDEAEEGIGTFVEVMHKSPALVGSEVVVTATLESIQGNELVCSFVARVGDRLIAEGRTGQKILERARIEQLFNGLEEA